MHGQKEKKRKRDYMDATVPEHYCSDIIQYTHGMYETVLPCVFVAELDSGKFYVALTRNFNELMAKWRTGLGPLWVREYKLKRIVEIDPNGNLHALRLMTIACMLKKGIFNVRSSIPGHCALQMTEPPDFFRQFVARYVRPAAALLDVVAGEDI